MQIKTMCATVALALLAGMASADELAEGLKARQDQDYARAHQLLGKLAQAGDREAQLRLGEMYGFGEGVEEDAVQAERWLVQAQAGGHKDAANALSVLQQRRLRKADIAFYRNAYTGAELAYGKQGCVAPTFTNSPDGGDEVKEVKARMAEWAACFNGFAKGLAAALPAGKLIPADLVALMSAAEQQQARNVMEQAYLQLLHDGEQAKQLVFAEHDAWLARTDAWEKVVSRQRWDQFTRQFIKSERVAYRPVSLNAVPANNGNKGR